MLLEAAFGTRRRLSLLQRQAERGRVVSWGSIAMISSFFSLLCPVSTNCSSVVYSWPSGGWERRRRGERRRGCPLFKDRFFEASLASRKRRAKAKQLCVSWRAEILLYRAVCSKFPRSTPLHITSCSDLGRIVQYSRAQRIPTRVTLRSRL